MFSMLFMAELCGILCFPFSVHFFLFPVINWFILFLKIGKVLLIYYHSSPNTFRFISWKNFFKEPSNLI